VNSGPKWIGGQAAFAIGTLRAMSTYRNAPVTVKTDGKTWYEGRMFVTAIANGRYFGGGMHIAPDAHPGDGLFDVVVLGDLSFAETLTVAPKIYRGAHLGATRVHVTRATEVEATPLDGNPVYIDADGEEPGRLPLKARVLRGALNLRA
jgi:diacylglycerol kinase family enzyme